MTAHHQTHAALGDLLTSPPPVIPPEHALSLAETHFGLRGTLKPLTSERDANFLLRAPDGRGYVLKFANLAEPAAQTDFQITALRHLEAHAPTLPVPRALRSLDGRDAVALPGGLFRVLSYLEGVPLHLSPNTAPRRAAMGRMAAALSQGLAGFSHPAADHTLLWDIRQAAGLRPLLTAIADTDLRTRAEATLDQFETAVAPALPACRWQVVHNDLNPHNVLADPARPDQIAGVLDFGDMVRTALVCDLAVAASYQIDPAAPLDSLVTFTAAYHQTLPLLPVETALIFDLVATRMLTTIAIASWRAARYPGNAAYILRNLPSARAGLNAFAALPRATVQSALARATE